MRATLATAAMALLLPALAPRAVAQQPPALPAATASAQAGGLQAEIGRAMEAKRWEPALALIDAGLRDTPDDGRLWTLRARVLDQLGRAEDAVHAYERSVASMPGDASVRNDLCWAQIRIGRWEQARAVCERAVALDRSFASTANLGHTYLLAGDTETAYRWYRESVLLLGSEQALRDGPLADFDLFVQRGWQAAASTAARRWMEQAYVRLREAMELTRQVAAGSQAGHYADMLPIAQQALALSEQVLGAEHPLVGKSLGNLARVYQLLNRYGQALPLYQRALAISEKADGAEHPSTGTTLDSLALLYQAIGRYEEALPLAQRALYISEKANGAEYPTTGRSLSNLAGLYRDMGRYEQALPLAQRALAISEKAYGIEHPSTATSLSSLALLYQATGRYEQALPLFQRALAIGEKANGAEHPITSTRLSNLAVLYRDMGRYEEALPLLQRALAISEKVHGAEHANTGVRLNNLSQVYRDLGRYEEALPLAQRALDISEKVHGAEHPDTGTRLSNLATLYQGLGRYEQALPLYQRALAISEKAEGAGHPNTGIRLNNLATLYRAMGRYEEALPLAQRALYISEKVHGAEHLGTATSLNSLAQLYQAMGRYEEALPLFQRALYISEKVNGADHPITGKSLNNLARLYGDMGRNEQALPLVQRALRVLLAHGQSPVELSVVAGNLASLHHALGHPEQAAFFGKQSVNGFQALRAGMRGLDRDLQQGFLEQYENYYRRLAGWLVDAGRLAEAQQVTAMLKEQELFELLRRDAEADPRASRAGFTGFEAPLQREYEAIGAQLATAAHGLDELDKEARVRSPGTEEDPRRAAFEQQLAAGRDAFERYISSLEAAFARLEEERRNDVGQLNLAKAQGLQSTLDKLGHGAVLLHYVVLDEELKIILTTPRLQRGYTVKVGRKTLNQAIAELRQGIERRADVQALAQRLHGWLIDPVQADLRTTGARTLMVALTDALRYLPFAALHDGRQWLGQRYAVALYTEAARQDLSGARMDSWRLQAFGLTRHVEGFEQLPAVRDELDAIVGAQGLPGQAWLDEQFTAASFKQAVRQRPPVLHVASHFVFRPGTELDSFLLLGDGAHLSLADIKGLSFRELDLLTLSACNTALGGGRNENGREIEGFGALAQMRGAGAVLATLWSVADQSTAQFMQRFYLSHQGNAGMSKAEALQQAQRAMIEGWGQALITATPDGDSSRKASRPGLLAMTGAAIPVDPAKPYAHPYFWAPFVLMGNWL